ncbi:ribosomal-processing cysteine protease Prp [Amphibacillus sp. Q70]|uniref:ribosomal-processing cysteine protease Prp n=1 Tax=Amphibacillus sp. Q70 TaxID=3453416 RepID=UPI003F864F92
MIKVNIHRNKSEDIIAFELSGHADSGPHGHDLVCAAVSAVAFGMTNAVMELSEIEPIIDQGGQGGYLKVTLPDEAEGEAFEKATLLLEGMLTSLVTIERDYGQYISISEK